MENLNKLAEKIYDEYYWLSRKDARLEWLNELAKEQISNLGCAVNNIQCDYNSTNFGVYKTSDIKYALESLLIICHIYNIDLNKEFAYAND